MKSILPLLSLSLAACNFLSDLGHQREPAIVTSQLAILSEDPEELAFDAEDEIWDGDPTASCEVDGDDNEATGRFDRSFAFVMAAREGDPVALGVNIALNERGVYQTDIGLNAQGTDAWRPREDCSVDLVEWDYEARFFEFSADCTFTLEGEADLVVFGKLRAERCFDRSAVSIDSIRSIVSDAKDAALDLGEALVEDPVGFAEDIARLPLYAAGAH